MSVLQHQDPILSQLLQQEQDRQEQTISLIASENYANSAVLEVVGSVLTNKYAEGYPGKRYYAGCQVVDQIEHLAIERCKELFGVEHANVQPHAGSQANMAAYWAVLKPGDTIMGMSLAHGGHLTHGHPVNFSGLLYNIVSYTVDRDTEQLDYDAIEKLAHQYKPKLIIAGASAYSRVIDFQRFSAIACSVGALLLADIAHIAGLVAVGLHPSPAQHADIITSTTHKTLRGPRGGLIMSTKKLAESIDRAIIPGTQGGPFMQVIAAKATAFLQATQPNFKQYQQQVINNARVLSDELQQRGYRIVSGGTDNHLFIVDLEQRLTGLQAERALEMAGITVSRSCIPFDTQKPWVTSGIRLGTPAITTRGATKEHMVALARMIDNVLRNYDHAVCLQEIKQHVTVLCKELPIPS